MEGREELRDAEGERGREKGTGNGREGRRRERDRERQSDRAVAETWRRVLRGRKKKFSRTKISDDLFFSH